MTITPGRRLLCNALEYHGVKEIPGREANPLILEWIRVLIPWARDDSLSWCAIFLFHVASKTGLETPPASEAPAAAAWRKAGSPVLQHRMTQGDIVILYRGSRRSWRRHVGILVSRSRDHVWLCGGNQSNAVNIRRFPISRIDQIRRLSPRDPKKAL